MEFVDVACNEPTADRVPVIRIVQLQCDKYTFQVGNSYRWENRNYNNQLPPPGDESCLFGKKIANLTVKHKPVLASS